MPADRAAPRRRATRPRRPVLLRLPLSSFVEGIRRGSSATAAKLFTVNASPTDTSTLPSLDALYADPRRRRSRERDLGLTWRARDGSTYRVAWIEETEELYAFRHLDPDGHGGGVRILGRIPAARVERGLRDWPAHCGDESSYEWLCWQVRRLRARAR
jgi:hypothetical protein